jgi:3,4-dihydroxy 2-butanone 4-phosphate synthase/GTP cyclohydrolase II
MQYTMPAIAVPVVIDPTGAGDAFVTGFSYGIVNHYSIGDSVLCGSVLSSECIRAVGATSNINVDTLKIFYNRIEKPMPQQYRNPQEKRSGNASYMPIRIIDRVLNVKLNNDIGEFNVGAYKVLDENDKQQELLVIYKGEIGKVENLRLNSACFTGDLFGCLRCDCNEQMVRSLEYFNEQNNGILIYLIHQDGYGHGIVNKLRTYMLMDKYNITTAKSFELLNMEVDVRDYSTAAAILLDNGIDRVNLITNNPNKIAGLEMYGIQVSKRIPIVSEKPELRKYLQSKKIELNHLIEFSEVD